MRGFRSTKRKLSFESLERRRLLAAFTPGNLAVYRVGDGSAELSNVGNPVFIDEYAPSGALIQSIALPSSGENSLVASGGSFNEGLLTRSTDGNYLVFAGYGPSSIPYPTSIVTSTAITVPRVVGRIDANGNFDGSTRLNDYSSQSSPRGVASTNGHDFWFAGGAGGVRYGSLGSTSSLQLSTTMTNLRGVAIADSQLYVSTQVAANATRLAKVGVGLPISGNSSIDNLPGSAIANLSNPFAMFFADLDGQPGSDTLYVATDGTSGLQKLSLVAGSWQSNGQVGGDADDYRGLTGFVSGNSVQLFATRAAGTSVSGGGELVSITDTSGFNGTLNSSPVVLATANFQTTFRGVAITPGTPTTPVFNVASMDATKYEGDNQAASSFSFLISRSGVTTGTTTVSWSVAASTQSPASAADFVGSIFPSGTVTFAPGELTKIVHVPVVGDNVIEADEGFVFALSNPTLGSIFQQASAYGTILNDDANTKYKIVATDLSKLEGNQTPTSFTFTVERIGDTTLASTVDYSLSGAVQTNDFAGATTLPSGTLTFEIGQTSQTITLWIESDSNVETDEFFSIDLSNPSSNTAIAIGTALGTIRNDDASINATLNRISIIEGNSGATTTIPVSLTRSGYLGSTISANWQVTSALEYSVNNADFIGGVLPSGTITFPADGLTTSLTVMLALHADNQVEFDEAFNIQLSNPSLGAIVSGTASFTVENDDILPLLPSDIVITGVDGAQDSFTFVPLVQISPNAILKFTDAGWTGSTFAAGEGRLTFQVGPDGIAAGTELKISAVNTASPIVSPANAGTAFGDFLMNLSTGGENLFAYQGPDSSPSFLYAVNLGADYLTSGYPTNTTTYLPNSLIIGTSATQALGGIAIAEYNDFQLVGTKSQLSNSTANPSLWNTSAVGLTQNNFTVMTSTPAVIVNRRFFYNRAPSPIFNSGGINPSAAIDPSRNALLPGQASAYSNVSNYIRGINGLVFDVANWNGLALNDIEFATSNGLNPFVTSTAVPTLSLLPGAGFNNSTRIKIEFPDDAVKNTWLRVTILANANTGLSTNEVAYFGHVVADMNVGDLPANPIGIRVTATDTAYMRLNQSPSLNSSPVSSLYDINKDGRVTATDTALIRLNQRPSSVIYLFTAPSLASFQARSNLKQAVALAPLYIMNGAALNIFQKQYQDTYFKPTTQPSFDVIVVSNLRNNQTTVRAVLSPAFVSQPPTALQISLIPSKVDSVLAEFAAEIDNLRSSDASR